MYRQAAEQRCRARSKPTHRVLAAGVVTVLVGLAAAPAAFGQGLAGMRSDLAKVQQQKARASANINESTAKVNSATARLIESQNELAQARAHLADIRVQLAAARELDAALAVRLKAEQEALEEAKRAVAEGEANLAAQLKLMGIAARDAYQQRNPLEGLSIVFNAGSTSDLSQRLQWNTTIFDTQAAQKTRLDEIQVALNAARDRQAAIEAEVAERKAEAARQVGIVKGLERAAKQQEAAVAALVVANQGARDAAQAELQADQTSYLQLKGQEDNLKAEIQSELARLKAEAERRAREEAERKAREEAQRKAAEAAAKKKAADQAKANASVPPSRTEPAPSRSGSGANRSASDPTGYGVSRYGLIRPIAARNGSPFGMRFHPILKYWRMHNGTDFGAPTGTPLYAAADGIVLRSGPNGGFGNFVLIGHNASINGRYVTTGYAHQSRIVVSVGQRVKQGQLIGYVGSTGLSTTPHLHLEVRLDGTPVNPMTYIP